MHGLGQIPLYFVAPSASTMVALSSIHGEWWVTSIHFFVRCFMSSFWEKKNGPLSYILKRVLKFATFILYGNSRPPYTFSESVLSVPYPHARTRTCHKVGGGGALFDFVPQNAIVQTSTDNVPSWVLFILPYMLLLHVIHVLPCVQHKVLCKLFILRFIPVKARDICWSLGCLMFAASILLFQKPLAVFQPNVSTPLLCHQGSVEHLLIASHISNYLASRCLNANNNHKMRVWA